MLTWENATCFSNPPLTLYNNESDLYYNARKILDKKSSFVKEIYLLDSDLLYFAETTWTTPTMLSGIIWTLVLNSLLLGVPCNPR